MTIDANTAALRVHEHNEAENERIIERHYDEARETLLTSYWYDPNFIREALGEWADYEILGLLVPLMRAGTDDAELGRLIRERANKHVKRQLDDMDAEDAIRELALKMGDGPVYGLIP